VNEKPSDDPIPTIRTDSGVKVTPEQLAAIKSLPLFGRNFHPVAPAPSRCDWLLDRYPEEFVRSLMEGGRCDLRSRAETLPTLDAYPWSWGEMVRASYAVFVAWVAIDLHQVSMALREFADSCTDASETLKQFAAEMPPEEKERGAMRERKAGRAERRMDQPWRKQHR
jgi:hypothetical protein